MENTMPSEAPAGRARKKLSGYFKAFIVLFVLFFAAGFATLGSFRSTGRAFEYVAEDDYVAVYNLEMGAGQSKLKAVYINVGSVYVKPGTDVRITVKKSASKDSKPTSTVGSVTLGNLYSVKKGGKEGGNFNWLQVATDKSLTAGCVSVSSTVNFALNEIVCLADDDKPIALSVNTDLSQGFTSRKKELGYAIDAQSSFSKSSAARNNFTAEEGYYMTSVHTVLGGKDYLSGSTYTIDKDFNALATVLLLPSVAIFGDSTFALRLTPFLAACATLFFVYLLGSLLFKNEKYGFMFALLFAFGGLATTVGRLGAPYALLTFFLVASLYFMYRFFSKGISSGHTVKGGLNILFSGLCSAFALAMNTLSIFPVLGILTLFGFGMRRQKLAYVNAVNKHLPPEKAEESPSDGATSVAVIGKEGKKLKAQYAYKNRVSWSFAVLSFAAATFVLLLLASVVCYSAYVKVYDDPSDPVLGYGSLLLKGLSAPFKIDNLTEYTSANAANVLAWLLPLKAATVYDGILETGASRYLAWNVSMNAAAAVASLVCFAFSTVSVVSELFTKNRGSRINKRTRRIYLVLLGGLVLSMLSCAFVRNISAVHSSLFGVFYLGFIPLAVRIAQPDELRLRADGKAKTAGADILFIVCMAAIVIFFALSVPSMYGFEISAKAAKYMFGWMSIASNGYYRIANK